MMSFIISVKITESSKHAKGFLKFINSFRIITNFLYINWGLLVVSDLLSRKDFRILWIKNFSLIIWELWSQAERDKMNPISQNIQITMRTIFWYFLTVLAKI